MALLYMFLLMVFQLLVEMVLPQRLGDNVTIGHNATIHACKIDDNALIGMGSIVLDNAIINHMAFIAAGAVITPGSVVKEMNFGLVTQQSF